MTTVKATAVAHYFSQPEWHELLETCPVFVAVLNFGWPDDVSIEEAVAVARGFLNPFSGSPLEWGRLYGWGQLGMTQDELQLNRSASQKALQHTRPGGRHAAAVEQHLALVEADIVHLALKQSAQ